MIKNKLLNALRQQYEVLFYLIVLTGFFILVEFSFFLQCHRSHFNSFAIASKSLTFPLTIVPGILFFIFSQLLVHLSFTFFIWCVTVVLAQLFNWRPLQTVLAGSIGWTLGLILVLCANQLYFPNAQFAELTRVIFINDLILKIVLLILFGFWSGVFLCVIFGLFRLAPFFSMLVLCIAGFIALLPSGNHSSLVADASSSVRPNIILIGVDSLRPDFVGFFGRDTNTPFIDGFLKQATVFSEAVTPIARTFPSWAAILTGEYPHMSGIRTNLMEQHQLNYSHTLPALLRQAGYDTVFATDETRFSNIDTQMGFEHIIAPPMGFNDFLLGTLNDFPLSNLLVNTRIGEWLFPYSYANRPAYFVYQPETFIQRLDRELAVPRNKPLFLAAHFCLTHAPFHWADSPVRDLSLVDRYDLSVRRVDQQLKQFYDLLKHKGLLEHAVVVLLSDHGEALALTGDRITDTALYVNQSSQSKGYPPHFYPSGMADEGMNQSIGHGTDVLGLPQYHTLLAWRLLGEGRQSHCTVTGVVSLLDIKPTVLAFAGVANQQPAGLPSAWLSHSLVAQIQQGSPIDPLNRPVFLESDFSPQAIRSVHPEIEAVVIEGIHAFQIDPITTHLVVKEPMVKAIIDSKQYAIIEGHWMLALYPQENRFYQPILINLENGRWTDNLRAGFAKQAPAQHLLASLKSFYSKDIHMHVK